MPDPGISPDIIINHDGLRAILAPPHFDGERWAACLVVGNVVITFSGRTEATARREFERSIADFRSRARDLGIDLATALRHPPDLLLCP